MFEDSVHCVIRRRTVRIAWTQLAPASGRPAPEEPAVPVCLDFGEACNATRCPTFQVPRAVMAAWVARAGLGHGRLRERRERCGLCGREAELQEIEAGVLYCPLCRGINPAAGKRTGRDGASSSD